jgi:hypothetical protein
MEKHSSIATMVPGFHVVCGDWVSLAPLQPRLTARLGRPGWRKWRHRAHWRRFSWRSTTGRVFITKNVDAEPASAVSWTRLDDDVTVDPNRYVSSIFVDPADGNHAWVSYSGFSVTQERGTSSSDMTKRQEPSLGDLSYDFGDLRLQISFEIFGAGDLYASSDFGVMRLADSTNSWTQAAPGMPNVEVAGLTIVPSERKLYAATHGLSAWSLNLP